jgi:hypothetical protein
MSESDSPPPPPQGWIGLILRQEKEEKEPEKAPDPIDKIAKTLAGGYAVVAVILTTIGTLQGGLERLLLNQPWWTLFGLLLALAGVVSAFVAAYIVRQHGWRVAFVVLAVLLFIVGVVITVGFGTRSLSANERPGITTTASMSADGSALKGQVTAFGVKAKDWIYLSAKGFQATSDEQPASPVLLYQTRAGPNRNGKVDLSFEIPVALNRFDFVRIGATRANDIGDERIDPCFEPQPDASVDQSCATLYPPHGSDLPTLSTTWEKSGSVNVFSVTVKAAGVDPANGVLLDVSNASTGRIVYRSIVRGSATGAVDVTAKVPVAVRVRRVCVSGTTINATDGAALQEEPTKRTCQLGSFDPSKATIAIFAVPR